MYEVRLITKTQEEAQALIDVIAEAEDEGDIQFEFTTYSPVNIADACCEAGAD